MAYLHDNQYLGYNKKKSSYRLVHLFFVILIILAFVFLRKPFKNFAYKIAVPILDSKTIFSRGLYSLTHSKSDLLNRIESLESQNAELQTKLIDYSLVENENSGFKGSVISNINGIVGTVIARPSKTLYDTLLIKTSDPLKTGSVVYSISGVPLGNVSDEKPNILIDDENNFFANTITLYSNPGNEIDADIILNNAMDAISVKLKGRGGGAYESVIPADVNVPVGSFVVIPEFSSKPIAEVVKISNRNDTKDKVIYFRSTVNFQYLRYILITK
jgi:hypothetical protein